MAQLSAPVSTAQLPVVGLFPTTFPADSPTIRMITMPDNGYVVAYDRNAWTADVVEGLMRMHLGDFDLIEPATDGA